MIRYALLCEHAHAFEAWFGSSDAYDEQAARGLVECPVCATRVVSKQIMAPAVAGTKAKGAPDPAPQMQAMMMQAAQAVRAHVESTFDYVGDGFADEARAIHEGRAEERGVYGEATPKQVRALVEDGVPVAPLPPKPVAKEKLN